MNRSRSRSLTAVKKPVPGCDGMSRNSRDWRSAPGHINILLSDNHADKHDGAISWNGGYSWNPSISSGTAIDGGGSVAVNADGSIILRAPTKAAPVYPNNAAYSWNSLATGLSNDVKILADGFHPNLLYADDPTTGQFYASGDKAASWATTNAGLIQWGSQLTARRHAGPLVSAMKLRRNSDGCGTGEQLPVDSNKGTVLFPGTNQDGHRAAAAC